MPDLSPKGVHQFWSQYQDSMIYRVVSFLEGVEHWILDGDPTIEAAMEQFGKELDDVSQVDFGKLGHEDPFMNICNAVSSARALRLLQAIDTVHPGSASKLLIYAEENSKDSDDPAGLFLRRNIVFERLRLLSRVFSKDRMKLVLTALEGEDSD